MPKLNIQKLVNNASSYTQAENLRDTSTGLVNWSKNERQRVTLCSNAKTRNFQRHKGM